MRILRKLVQAITRLLKALTPEPKVVKTITLKTGLKAHQMSNGRIIIEKPSDNE